MPKTVQIRDIDDETYAGLVRRAADDGMTVPELLRREAGRLASEMSMKQWLERTRRKASRASREDVLKTFDELRGDWPDDRR